MKKTLLITILAILFPFYALAEEPGCGAANVEVERTSDVGTGSVDFDNRNLPASQAIRLEIFSAPESIEIDGHAYSLATSMWQNLMPSFRPPIDGFHIILKMIAEDLDQFPEYLDMTQLWIINAGDVWHTSKLYAQSVTDPLNILKKRADGNLTWVDVYVDVVVEVVDRTNGESYFLKAADQYIKAAY